MKTTVLCGMIVGLVLALATSLGANNPRSCEASNITSYDDAYARALKDTAYCKANNINPCPPGASLGI